MTADLQSAFNIQQDKLQILPENLQQASFRQAHFPNTSKTVADVLFLQMRQDIENTPSTVECSAPLHNDQVAVLRDCICGLHYR